MPEIPRRQRIALLAVAVLLGLSGCTGLRLHDASKAAVADSAKQQLKDAKVTETVDEALKNSKKFLDEAERIAGLEAEVRKKRAQLGIAESDRSMAAWLQARWTEQAALGFENTATVHARLQANTLVEGAKNAAEKNRARLKYYTKDPAVAAFLIGPPCAGITEESSPPEASKLDAFDIGLYEADFVAYRDSCVALARAEVAAPDDIESGSALDLAQTARAAAEGDRDALLVQIQAEKQKLDAARNDLKAAQKAAKAGKSDLTELKEKAGKVSKAAGKVMALAEKIGLESAPLDNIKHLAVILAAVSSGQIDEDAVANNESLATASLAAAELPSLAEDAIALLAAGKAPPTNHLILELNHQQILYNRALALSNLWIEELGLHDQKIAALEEQAKQYREIQYRLCNYATQKADNNHQGPACAIMSFENAGAVCKIGPADAQVTIDGCVLAKSWRDNYKGSNDPRAKRQLLAALLAHSRALDAQTAVRKTDFQMIDIGHKRIAASNRAAVAAWNNLVAVPVDTLAAYYAAGIKPDTIASAAAQLLGLLGIGVGIGVSP
jgi:hypothetical protein